MTDFIIVPGIGGSGEAHWQTRWQRVNPAMRRFMPASWELPDFDDWIAALETAVSEAKTPPVLVAHSLGCLLVAHWQRISGRDVSGAFLVAVPDPAASA
ncbi:MAG: serine hydrolase family protein, partial [Mesorhizobium sp.]